MKRPSLLLPLLVLTVIAFLSGCYPDKIDYVDEYDLAGTIYDENENFTSHTTFHVVDTIIHLTEDGEDDPNFKREHDEFILELVRENMVDMGYVEEPRTDTVADLVLFVEALSSDFYQYWGYWYDYWYWYPGWDWWYPGYPWYPSYPWYPGYVSSYSTGTLIVEMGVDMDKDPANQEEEDARIVWMGLVDGLLAGSSDYTEQRLEKQINQLFIQSEYLRKTK